MSKGRVRQRDRRVAAGTLALLASHPLLLGQTQLGTSHFGSQQAMGFALVAGLGLFSALCGFAVVRTNKRAKAIEQEAALELSQLADKLARAEALNRFDNQIVVVWSGPSGPTIELHGALSRLPDLPQTVEDFVAFDGWLASDSAAELQELIRALRRRGEAFSTTVKTTAGERLEAEGRCVGASALLRLRDLSPERADLARTAERYAYLLRDAEGMRGLLGEMPHPAWIRGTDGKLIWVNAAYAKAVGAIDAENAVARGVEFLDESARREVDVQLASGRSWRRGIHAKISGLRRTFDILVAPVPPGSAGVATDVSEIESGQQQQGRLIEAHRRTLDNLPTAIAMFGPDRRLVYHNPAWRDLWDLDAAFLADGPEEGAVLDRLRALRQLPEQANYSDWKRDHLRAYEAKTPREAWWYLPDGRTIRVLTHPNPSPPGGITVIYQNETEMHDLKSRQAAFERMQRETLNALTDAVAVFGSDGRLRLSNPAFAQIWSIEPAQLVVASERGEAGPHIDTVIGWWRQLHDDATMWERLKSTVIALGEDRSPFAARLTRRDGSIIDAASMPLPEGATLITFVDVTASVNVERMLKDRNEALEAAAALKNAFIQHVSYELRSPLTNIIGFAELLADANISPLNPKQREYTGYIMSSSKALLAIINDILDLATIDAGVMELDLTRVGVAETMQAAAEGVQDRLAEESVRLVIDAPSDIGAFTADAKRVRQVLYNLLSNALGFSEPGQTVTLSARRSEAGDVVFQVTDQGKGIDGDVLDRVFDRFETHTAGTRHRGVGLGLSIVKSFVELHRGRVEIESTPGRGTAVTCVFPAAPALRQSNDERAA